MPNFDDDVMRSDSKVAHRTSTPGRDRHAHATADPSMFGQVMRLQRLAGNRAVAQLMGADDDRASVERAVSGGGSALDGATRVQMERTLGSDLSSVRVHTGTEADASAKQLGAHAYTVGDDVVFANGRYDPGSTSGQRTIAHELTHVVQQRSGPVDGTDTGGGVKVSDPSDRFEQEAEATADSVVSRQADATADVLAHPTVQREAAVDEEPEAVQAMSVQRDAEMEEEPEEVQALSAQREGEMEEEPEEVQELSAQREDAVEEEEAVV